MSTKHPTQSGPILIFCRVERKFERALIVQDLRLRGLVGPFVPSFASSFELSSDTRPLRLS